mgnify:CR=1 FL=1
MLSVLDIFRIGIGPSSSHTVGPMRIARTFVQGLAKSGRLARTARVAVELQGSLALTGVGHGTVDASILGLMGFAPDTTCPDEAADALDRVRNEKSLALGGKRNIGFDPATDIDLAGHIIPDLHPNGMTLTAYDGDGAQLSQRTYYSTGGGFVASEAQLKRKPKDDRINTGTQVPHDFGSAEELLAACASTGLPIAHLVLANEDAFRPREKTLAGIDRVAAAMDQCIDRGLSQRGLLPGGLKVVRRAPDLWDKLSANPQSNEREQLFDWLNCYAMAVNEENAALRKAIKDADYECGVGLLRLNQLDLVTVVASPATVRRSATVPSPGATHLAIWTSSMRSPLLYRSRRGATVPSALSVDNDSARPWTTTRWR